VIEELHGNWKNKKYFGWYFSQEQRAREVFLYKTGLAAQFSSAEERDDWMKKERKSLRKTIEVKRSQIEKIQERARIDESIAIEKEHLDSKSKIIEEHKEQ